MTKRLHRCTHSRSHITDSRFHGHGYSTAESHRIFCDVCRLQRWLDVEVALAQSQADLGMIPRSAAERIAAVAKIGEFDLADISAGVRSTGHSLVALLRCVEQADPEAGRFVHWGATTQDIQDTAQSLEIKDVLRGAHRALRKIIGVLSRLAHSERDTLMTGRTHAQPALPLTFGFKVAGWIDELLRHLERLDEVSPRLLVAELCGGVGTMAGFGEYGPQLIARFAARLGLSVPPIGWHVIRDREAEYVCLMAMIAGTCARIANEIRMLERPELRELEEYWTHGQVGSSTMPHKRNPEVCEQIVMLAHLARAQVPVALDGMRAEHERDGRTLRLEWVAAVDTSHYTLTSLHLLLDVTSRLRANRETMAATARAAGDWLCSEALMLELARRIGKSRAYEKVYEVTQAAISAGRGLKSVLHEDADMQSVFSAAEIESLMDPARYTGQATSFVDATIARAAAQLRACRHAKPEFGTRIEAERPAKRRQRAVSIVPAHAAA